MYARRLGLGFGQRPGFGQRLDFGRRLGPGPQCQKACMSGLCCIGATRFLAGPRVVECFGVRWLDHGTA